MIRELIVTTVVTGQVTGSLFVTWATSPMTAWPLWIYTIAACWWFIRQLDTPAHTTAERNGCRAGPPGRPGVGSTV